MQAHKQRCISSAVFLWCDIVVIFIAGFIFTGVCQAVLAPLQAHMLWQTDGLSIPLAGILPYMGLLGHIGLHNSLTASRPILLVLIVRRKLQLGRICGFMGYACCCRHAARHVQAGHAALGEVHLRHLHRAQRRGELHCLHLQTLWVSVHLGQHTVPLSTFGQVCQLCTRKGIHISQVN